MVQNRGRNDISVNIFLRKTSV